MLRASAGAERRSSAKDALGFDITRRREELRTRESRDVALVEELRKELVELEGKRAITSASIEQLEYEIESTEAGRANRRPYRRRADGQARHLREGRGTARRARPRRKASARGVVRAVDCSRPSARGSDRARAARWFPWIEYGTVRAAVTAVGTEPREGKIRVELDLDAEVNQRIPLEHGLVGTAEIVVGRTTPATLLLRALGRAVARRARTRELPARDGDGTAVARGARGCADVRDGLRARVAQEPARGTWIT